MSRYKIRTGPMYLYAKYERKDNNLTADLDRKRKKIWNEIEKMVSKLPRYEKT